MLQLSHFIEQGFRWGSIFGQAWVGPHVKPVFILWTASGGVAGPLLPSLVHGVSQDFKPRLCFESGALSPG